LPLEVLSEIERTPVFVIVLVPVDVIAVDAFNDIPAPAESVIDVTPELVTYPLPSTNEATAAEVGRFALDDYAEIEVSTAFAAAAARVPTFVVVKLDDPAQVDNAVFSTLPSPTPDLVIFTVLVAEPLYVN